MKRFLLYGHGGCYNHGVEAITGCTIEYLRRCVPGCEIILVSHFPEQDKEFGLCPNEYVTRDMKGTENREVYQDALDRITSETVAIHVGGDNYCYRNWQRYALIHEETKRKGGKSIFWGCSIDENVIDEEMLGVLRDHDLILAREANTYETLIGLGLSNVKKVADIAFGMGTKETTLPFTDEPYIVLNCSPLVCRKNAKVLDGYRELMNYILRETEYGIALLPHVVMPVDNDCDVLQELGIDDKRVVMVSANLSAKEYKYIISHASMCVAARTHVSIAAYSTLVPTLVTGYSTKAQGIARDLNMLDYVLDVEEPDFSKQLLWRFQNLLKNRKTIQEELQSYMPEYIDMATPQGLSL